MQLNITTLDINVTNISISVARKLMVAEASDIGLQTFDQLYDDACDIGIALRNPDTRTVTRWYMAEGETVRRKGDIMCWHLYPTTETINRHPTLAGFKLTIYND